MYRLSINTTTWKRDSHGLFDNESTSIEKYDFSLLPSFILARSAFGELSTFLPGEPIASLYTPLFRLAQINTGTLSQSLLLETLSWTLEACTKKSPYESPETQLWTALDISSKEYKLKRGDILRIGRIQVKVKDYRIESSLFAADKDSLPAEDNIVDLQEKDDKPATTEDVCKICFGVEESPENPLLSICKCTGSMKFVHYLCLKTWLHSNTIEKVTPQVISYYWKLFRCEICTVSYPCIS